MGISSDRKNTISDMMADGSAQAPGLAFRSDPDSGLVRASENKIRLITSGRAAAGITIDDGNVGIGAVSPTTRLDVNGDISFTGTQTIVSTDAGATVGPILKLHRNSASPADNDIIGAVYFDGEDDKAAGGEQTTYASIQAKIIDASDTTEDGQLQFYTMKAGTLTLAASLNQGGDFSPSKDIYLPEYIYHAGDTDTLVRFQTNHINIDAGGQTFIDMDSSDGDLALSAGDIATAATAGGDVDITGGQGGAGGAGGAIDIDGGSPASGDAAGGAIEVNSGAGSGTGAGGAITIASGASGSGATGNAGAINITGGNAASTDGNGGNVTITAGDKAGGGADGIVTLKTGSSIINRTGGAVIVTDEAGTGAGVAGSLAGQKLTIRSTDATASGNGGDLDLTAGAANTSGTGGTVDINAGAAVGANAGGAVELTGGAGGAGGAGGGVDIDGGAPASGSANGGAVTIDGGSAGAGGGTGGAVTINAGAAGGGTAGAINLGVTAATAINVGTLPIHSTGLGETIRLPITQGFDNDYAPVNAAAASEPDCQITGTIGTGLWAVSEAVQNGTKYGTVSWEVVLPAHYKAATNLTCTVNGIRVDGAGTTVSGSTDVLAYLMTDAGDFGGDICDTASQALTTSDADYAYTLTGATLTAGARLVISVTVSTTEAGNSGTSYSRINSVRLS